LQAGEEARKRRRQIAYVDTFDFQAKGFYEKLGYWATGLLGYWVYGNLPGYAHRHTSHYLTKNL